MVCLCNFLVQLELKTTASETGYWNLCNPEAEGKRAIVIQMCSLRGSWHRSKGRPSFCVLCSVASVSTGNNLQGPAVGALFVSREGNKWIVFSILALLRLYVKSLLSPSLFSILDAIGHFLVVCLQTSSILGIKSTMLVLLEKYMNRMDLCVLLQTKEIQQHFSLLPGLTVIAQSLNIL